MSTPHEDPNEADGRPEGADADGARAERSDVSAAAPGSARGPQSQPTSPAAPTPDGPGPSAARRGGAAARLALLAVAATAWAVLRGADGGQESLPPRVPLLLPAGAAAALVVALLGRTLAAGSGSGARRAPGTGVRVAVELLAAGCAALAALALWTEDLGTYFAAAGGVLLLQGASVVLLGGGALRVATPLVSVAGAALLAAAYFARPAAVRVDVLEWMGQPLAGDAAPSYALIGLTLGLLVPGPWGGATAALAALGRTRVSPFAVALLGCLPATVLVRGVARLSIGAEALYTVGAGGALVAAIAAAGTRGWTLPGDRSAACARAAALVGGAHALLVGGLGASSEAAVDAAWVGLAASFGLSLAVAFAVVGLDRLGTSAPPGFAPRGLGRLHPTTSLLLAVAALALAGAPPLASFAARVRALGEVTQSGAGREAFLLVVVQAPLFAAAALGLLHGLLRTPPEAGGEAPGVRGTRSGGTSTGGGLPRGGLRDGLLRTALLGLAAGLALAFGLFPDAPFGAAPHGSDPRGATFPSGAGQLELLVGAAVVFGVGVLLRRDSTGA